MIFKSVFEDLNKSIKEVQLEALAKGEVYPATIVADRYDGTYSGAKWIAFQFDSENVPEQIGGDDTDEIDFWERHNPEFFPIGKGSTPDLALSDLKEKLKEYYGKW